MQWIGRKRVAFVPVFRSRNQPPDIVPPDFAQQILTKVLFNPSAQRGGADFSLRGWLRAASSGRADIDPAVMPMQTSNAIDTSPTEFEGALGSSLRAQGFDHAAIVTLSGGGGTNAGFWSRFRLNEGIGVWAMEIVHGICRFPDLYHFNNDVDPAERDPGAFDEMAASALTHPTIFTKRHLGWADAAGTAVHSTAFASYALQLGSLTQPPAGGRAAVVKIGQGEPHMLIEARTRSDAYDAGIPSQGVIAYRVQWENPVIGERPGFRKPIFLLTPTALKAGESQVLDNDVTLTVDAAIPGGFSITVSDPGVHHVDRSSLTGARSAASAPTVLALDAHGIDNVCYRDTSGHLDETWRSLSGMGTADLTANARAPGAQGNPFLYYDPAGDQVVLLFRGGDSHVRSLYWMFGAVGHDLLTGSAPKTAGDPAGWFSTHDGFHHVVYRTSNGHLQELWWQGQGAVGHGDLTAQGRFTAAAGDPWPYYDPGRGTNIVAFRGTDRRIRSLYWGQGLGLGEDNLSGTAGTPVAASDPFAWFTAADDSHHVAYCAANGHVFELRWFGNAPVAGRDLTALSGAPAAAPGRVSGGYNRHDNTQHVIYRAGDGTLHELWYFLGDGAVGHSALTAAYGGPKSADRPAYFSTERAPHQHVAYRGSDGHIHEYMW